MEFSSTPKPHAWTLQQAQNACIAGNIVLSDMLKDRLIVIECEDETYTVGTDILAEYLDATLCDDEDCEIYTLRPQQCHDGNNYCDQHISSAAMACCRDCAWDGNIEKDF